MLIGVHPEVFSLVRFPIRPTTCQVHFTEARGFPLKKSTLTVEPLRAILMCGLLLPK